MTYGHIPLRAPPPPLLLKGTILWIFRVSSGRLEMPYELVQACAVPWGWGWGWGVSGLGVLHDNTARDCDNAPHCREPPKRTSQQCSAEHSLSRNALHGTFALFMFRTLSSRQNSSVRNVEPQVTQRRRLVSSTNGGGKGGLGPFPPVYNPNNYGTIGDPLIDGTSVLPGSVGKHECK